MARSIAVPRPPAAVSAAAARYGPLALTLLGAVGLVVAEFLTFREIKAVTAVPAGGTTTGGSHHGYALAVIAVASLPMSVGAVLGGARPAALALVVLGVLALLIVVVIDLPSLNDAGLIGRTYDLAKAHPAAGFWLELASALLLLGGGLFALRQNVVAARARDRARRAQRRTARGAT